MMDMTEGSAGFQPDEFSHDSFPPVEETKPSFPPLETKQPESFSAEVSKTEKLPRFDDSEPEDTTEYEPDFQNFDPTELGRLQAQVLQVMNQHHEGNALIQEYESKHPELVPYKDYIAVEVDKLQQAAHAAGKPLTPRQAIEAGIKAFKTQLQTLSSLSAHSKGGRVAMRLDMNSGQGKSAGSKKSKDIWSMSSEEFKEFDKQVLNGFYQY